MKRFPALLFALLALAALASAAGIELNVKEHVLANGMKILMIQKPGVPRVVCHVYYKVGSINERPGITGIAHVHEHMMFKGTEVMGVTDYAKDAAVDQQIDAVMDKIYREKYWKTGGGDPALLAQLQKEYDTLVQSEKQYIVKDQLWDLYMRNGGTGLNASTSNETTGYYVTLPSNKVELQMFLEADRMMNAYFREFYSEKDVVMEERRLSENRPGFLFSEQVDAAFYAASPYHWERARLDGRPAQVHQGRHDRVPRQVLRPQQLRRHLRRRLRPGRRSPPWRRSTSAASPRGRTWSPIRTGEPAQYSEKRLYGEGPAPTSLQMMFHAPAGRRSRRGGADHPGRRAELGRRRVRRLPRRPARRRGGHRPALQRTW